MITADANAVAKVSSASALALSILLFCEGAEIATVVQMNVTLFNFYFLILSFFCRRDPGSSDGPTCEFASRSS